MGNKISFYICTGHELLNEYSVVSIKRLTGLFFIAFCLVVSADDYDNWEKNGIYIYPQAYARLKEFSQRDLAKGELHYQRKKTLNGKHFLI